MTNPLSVPILCGLGHSYFGNYSDPSGSAYLPPSSSGGYDLLEVLLQLQPEVMDQLLEHFLEGRTFKTVCTWEAVWRRRGEGKWAGGGAGRGDGGGREEVGRGREGEALRSSKDLQDGRGIFSGTGWDCRGQEGRAPP